MVIRFPGGDVRGHMQIMHHPSYTSAVENLLCVCLVACACL